ncbi:MAG: hypothetical protein KAT65_03840, partial [Methanophagales archaeon]|nr:hypothetical protein [Methanophagales archaeon]
SADKKDFRFLPDFSNHKIQISNNLEFICDLVLGFWDFLMSRPEMNFVSVSSIATIDVKYVRALGGYNGNRLA